MKHDFRAVIPTNTPLRWNRVGSSAMCLTWRPQRAPTVTCSWALYTLPCCNRMPQKTVNIQLSIRPDLGRLTSYFIPQTFFCQSIFLFLSEQTLALQPIRRQSAAASRACRTNRARTSGYSPSPLRMHSVSVPRAARRFFQESGSSPAMSLIAWSPATIISGAR